MREIKYRAWHKQEKRMYEVIELTWDRNYPGKISSMGLVPLDKNGLHCITRPLTHVACENYVLAQFTGVRTYEDTEIYEGDIIEFQLYEPGKRYRREVAFIEGCFMADMATRLSTAMYVKVISNTWENPELLTGASYE